MIRRTGALFAAALLLVALMPSAALAARPEVVFEETFSAENELAFGMSQECGFDVYITETVDVKETHFFDKNGQLRKIRVHVMGDTLWSGPAGEAFEHWVVNVSIDPIAGTETVAGNRWNAHGGGGGILINGSGRVVIEFESGEMTVRGPSDDLDGNFTAFCAALAP